MTALEKLLKKVIEENCKKNVYAEKFSEGTQKEVKSKSDEIAKLTLQDEDFRNALELAIEDSIRIMIQNKEM